MFDRVKINLSPYRSQRYTSAIIMALDKVYQRSAVIHCGVLIEDSSGQRKICSEVDVHELDKDVEDACDLLVAKNKHPGLIIGKRRLTPFNLLSEELVFADDPEVITFLHALKSAKFQSVHYLPVYNSRGDFFVSAVASRKRALNSVEARLVHSHCLDAVQRVETVSIALNSDSDLLTPRERECLNLAARGYTEKQTAKLLEISPFTVHAHLENCKRKLGARNKLSAIVKGLQLGEIMGDEFEIE